jgi:hypothetical protein
MVHHFSLLFSLTYLSQSLPSELEKLLSRPDMSPHLSRIISSSLSPVIERYVKDTFTKTLVQQSTALHQELLTEVRSDMHKMKNDLMGWQSETLRNQDVGYCQICKHLLFTSFIGLHPGAGPHSQELVRPSQIPEQHEQQLLSLNASHTSVIAFPRTTPTASHAGHHGSIWPTAPSETGQHAT